MSDKAKIFIFYVIWFLIVISGPVTIFRNISLEKITSNDLILLNVFQRLSATVAFSMLSFQIILGSKMTKFIQYIGSGAFRFHVTNGLVAYALMLVHPLFENLIVYVVSQKVIESLLGFLPSFGSKREILMVLGKIALILVTITIVTAYLRKKPLFRKYWGSLHIINYFIFYFVFIHSRIGSDISFQPFNIVSWILFILVTWTLFQRFYPLLKNKFLLAEDNEKVNKKA